MSRHLLISTLALLAVCGFASRSAQAQDPAASWSCSTKAGILAIRYTPELSEVNPPWPKQPPPVHFMSLLDLNKAGSQIEGTRTKTVSCRLKSDRFEITLAPGIPNVNLLGRCGADVTGVVTVKRNGAVVLSEQEFEDMDCHARERMLERITFKDGSPKPDLTYVGYKE
ncbi:MAG TPA: hypothetical protein VGX68_13100 [Thermoanaerobaculia bacterium]|jgi:hypothetical protein|nr:hypothetical protein [Thermoanaerobaculia bacterium]